ncbi:acetyl-CoA C-acetyltransferase [Rhodococcus sp. T7]|uniref:acetyl-CoA C-acetyltransferase n=1 Tax=Rhodococcus sp. T7 TaxID=627444 RepID=UPI00135A6032|nr:acetyl-CoA C-acetyltransferase [Rhodococcus sp. T7]
MTEAYIYDAIRTPRGRGRQNGALHSVRPIQLITDLITETLKRNPTLDPAEIDDLVLGVVSPVSEQGADLAKTAAISAGLPDQVAGVQINRFCSSGLEAVNMAGQKIRSGWDQVVLAGGVESMSRVPMGSDGGALYADPATMYDNHLGPQGVSADLIATMAGFTRDDVDAYAVESHRRAAHAWSAGYFGRSIVPVVDSFGTVLLDHDQLVRPTSTVESLAELPPSFVAMGAAGFDEAALQKFHWVEKIDHVHTAANSSGIVDGAALVVVGSEAAGARLGLEPRARIAHAAVSGADPTLMLTGPTPATEKLLAQTGLTTDDIDLFELNEAFASVVLKYQADLKIPAEKLNVNGGAIAMGHPLGATGAMLVSTVIDELERRDQQRALVTLCIGGGMGIATLIERV